MIINYLQHRNTIDALIKGLSLLLESVLFSKDLQYEQITTILLLYLLAPPDANLSQHLGIFNSFENDSAIYELNVPK